VKAARGARRRRDGRRWLAIRLAAVLAQFGRGVLAVVVVAAIAGCGGGGSTYSLARTQACFKGKSIPAVVDVNHALEGSGGDLEVSIGTAPEFTDIFIVFGRNAKEALAIENRAVNLAEKSLTARHLTYPRSAVLAGVQLKKNVFYYSDSEAVSETVRDAIDACLR
jgi:hypothetical protein